MQPYEEENMEDMKNKMLARIEELKQEMANIREGWKQESRQRTPSLGQETQASIRTLEDQMAQVAKCGNEEEDTHDNTFEPTRGSEYENVEEKESVEGKENNMTSENNCIIEDVDNEVNFFNPCDFNDNDSFDFPDDDDEKCVDTCENNSFNSMENNSTESCVDNFSNSYDSNSSNPCENNSFVSLDDNDGLESFTFGDESLSNELVNDLHEILDDDEMNVDASLLELNDVEFVTYHDNCLEDALYIHDLIGKDRSEGVEKENVKEEVEDKKKTSNESVREEVKEKVRNDEKDFGNAKTVRNNNSSVADLSSGEISTPERNYLTTAFIFFVLHHLRFEVVFSHPRVDHQDYPYYSNHYENEEYMMQPYEEENMEDMKNKMLARIEELKQEMANIREGCKQESRQRTPSLGQETQASIRTLEDQMAQVAKCGNEEEDTHDNTFEPTRGSEYENVEEKESVEGK
nr:hypothetical protein Iba_chr09cCG8520 [Ipomoea batatas]